MSASRLLGSSLKYKQMLAKMINEIIIKIVVSMFNRIEYKKGETNVSLYRLCSQHLLLLEAYRNMRKLLVPLVTLPDPQGI